MGLLCCMVGGLLCVCVYFLNIKYIIGLFLLRGTTLFPNKRLS
jgi:hypothetical protein